MEEADKLLLLTLGQLGLELEEEKVGLFSFERILKYIWQLQKLCYISYALILNIQVGVGSLGPELLVRAVLLCLHAIDPESKTRVPGPGMPEG